MRTRVLAVLALAGVLGACGGNEPAPAADAVDNRELLEAAQAPLERAREVEDLSAARRAELDAAIEQAGDQ